MSAIEEPGFGIETIASGGSITVRVSGELDSGTSGQLVEAFERAVADRAADAPMSLDLKDVSFIDSSGMRAMIQIERSAESREISLVLVPPPDAVTELLRTAGITDRIELANAGESGPLGPDFLDRIELELDREPAAPSRARAEIREALSGRLDDSDLATVVLLTSELVTNAVIHPLSAGSTIGLRISVHDGGVRVEVEDPGEGFDPSSRVSSTRQGGRGLFLVEQCAATWGARRVDGEQGRNFCVWFEFTSGDRDSAAVPG